MRYVILSALLTLALVLGMCVYILLCPRERAYKRMIDSIEDVETPQKQVETMYASARWSRC